MVEYAEIKAVRIICDGVLKKTVIDKVIKLGASGYTWWEAHGKGRKEIFVDLYDGIDRLFLEVWCSTETADKIVDYFESDQFRSHGMSVSAEPLLVKSSEVSKYT